jgi:RNA polymerase sigma factor (sigma-70 family)
MNLNVYDPTKSKFKSWVLSIAKNYMIDRWRLNKVELVGTGTITALGAIVVSNDCTIYNTGNNGYNVSSNTAEVPLNGQIFTTANNVGSIQGNSLTFASNGGSYTSGCNNLEFENCNSVNYVSSQISSQDFTLLNMKYVQGYEYCEIGKEFNISSNTASNRVNYIKTKLKHSLEEIRD